MENVRTQRKIKKKSRLSSCEKTDKRHKKSVSWRLEMKMRKWLCCSSVVKFYDIQ
jgi:hypothetical protein